MAALEGDIKIPLVGKVPKKAAVGGVAVVGVLVVVYYVRKGSGSGTTAAAAAAATATDQYPPDGTTGDPTDPYSTDPATGQTYGDEASGSGGAYTAGDNGGSIDSGSFPWDGTTGDQADPYSLDPATGSTFGDEGISGGAGGGSSSGGPPFSSNSAWEAWAIQQLQTDDPGINQSNLTSALGEYLNGQPVDPADKALIFSATGAAGDPPVPGANGYPPNVRTNGSTGGAGATVAVPRVLGDPQEDAFSAIASAGLKAAGSKVQPGKVLYVTKQTPEAGAKVATGSTVTLVSSAKPATAPAAAAAVTVPDVVGKDVVTGSAQLQAAGLKLTPEVPAVKGKVHTITGQTPKAGAKAAKGSTVTITYKTT